MTDLMEQLHSYGTFLTSLDPSLDRSIADLDPGRRDDAEPPPDDDTDEVEHGSSSRGWILAVAAVVLAAVGFWVMRDDGASDPDLIVDTPPTTTSPDVEVVPHDRARGALHHFDSAPVDPDTISAAHRCASDRDRLGGSRDPRLGP